MCRKYSVILPRFAERTVTCINLRGDPDSQHSRRSVKCFRSRSQHQPRISRNWPAGASEHPAPSSAQQGPAHFGRKVVAVQPPKCLQQGDVGRHRNRIPPCKFHPLSKLLRLKSLNQFVNSLSKCSQNLFQASNFLNIVLQNAHIAVKLFVQQI